ncbi:MAG: glycosyltransferase family 10 [Kiritimatiellia bacterium]
MCRQNKIAFISEFFSPPTKDSFDYKLFYQFFEAKQIELIPFDLNSVHIVHDDIQFYIYYDYSWRAWIKDCVLMKVPYEKRVLIMGEPSNVNPSLYYFSRIRNKFAHVFAYDLNLLAKNSSYNQINVPVLRTDYLSYRIDKYNVAFSDKKFLIAVTANRWSYMPHSLYRLRRRIYRYFACKAGKDFDLYGSWWDRPASIYDKFFGGASLINWRGVVKGDWSKKIDLMSGYKFAICFENNASQPGYISEKILHCFCARCVPVYYGDETICDRIPKEAFIDWRDFKDCEKLNNFLRSMSNETYQGYISAINEFLEGDKIHFFTIETFFNSVFRELGLN